MSQTDESRTDEDDITSPVADLRRTLTIREEVLDMLLEKVEHDRYPSPTMLDDIERILTPWRREDYAEILLDKIRKDRYPSRSLIERVIRLSHHPHHH
jgi:hypothetical protein